jgi:hypothetical protein
MDTNEENRKINDGENICNWYNIQYVSNGFHNQINRLGGLNISRLQITGEDANEGTDRNTAIVWTVIHCAVLKVNMQVQIFHICHQYIIQFTFLHKHNEKSATNNNIFQIQNYSQGATILVAFTHKTQHCLFLHFKDFFLSESIKNISPICIWHIRVPAPFFLEQKNISHTSERSQEFNFVCACVRRGENVFCWNSAYYLITRKIPISLL